jgi:hypothetical protein
MRFAGGEQPLPTAGPKRDACLPKTVGKDRQHVGKFDAHSAYLDAIAGAS